MLVTPYQVHAPDARLIPAKPERVIVGLVDGVDRDAFAQHVFVVKPRHRAIVGQPQHAPFKETKPGRAIAALVDCHH